MSVVPGQLLSKKLCFSFLTKRNSYGKLLTSASSLTCIKRHYVKGEQINNYDVVVVGGGIVGAATARELAFRHPDLKLAIVEKETEVAKHQSGNNSGVIHAGIYYTPGSLKAKLCVSGLKKLYEYCDKNGVPYKRVGKLIVAVNNEESERLEGLYQRGLQNEVPGLELIGGERIPEIEPNCVGLKAIYSPITGIIDYGDVTRAYSSNFKSMGGTLHCGFEVIDFHESPDSPEYPISLIGHWADRPSEFARIRAKYVIGCAGLYSDRLAQLSGCHTEPKIVPFRGEYLVLKPEKQDLVRGNIYPVPNPRFPFLGVHFTPRMDGSIWLGPSAVLAAKREGYKFTDVNVSDLWESVTYRGTRKLVLGNILPGMGELYRMAFYSAQVKILQKYVPELKISDVDPSKPKPGVRAVAVDGEGHLVDDILISMGTGELGERVLNVVNIPYTSATSSLNLAEHVVDLVDKEFRF